MLRGELTANQQLALLRSHDDLAQALEGAFFVQVAQHRNTRGDITIGREKNKRVKTPKGSNP